MASHAKFSPSKMQRIIACPGSVALESTFTDVRSNYADEGTVAHEIASRCLQQKLDAVVFVGKSYTVTKEGAVIETTTAEKCFVIDAQFAEFVQVYIDGVRRLAHGKLLLVEQRVEFSQAIGVPGQFGTSDVIIYDAETEELIVIDLKFGMGVKVYAGSNEQMLTYAVGSVETFAEVLGPIAKVRLIVSQPRLDHWDEWECDMLDIAEHINKMNGAAMVAKLAVYNYEHDLNLAPEYFQAGEKQCMFCKAKASCPILAAYVSQSVYDDAEVLQDVHKIETFPTPRIAGPALIGARYGALDLIEQWIKATRAEVERMVFAGMEVIGPDGLRMKLGEGKKGNRAWVDEKVAEGVLAGQLSPDKLYKPRSLISPSEADKLLNKKKTAQQWELIKPLYKQAPGKPKVMLGSDPTPEWRGELKAEEFIDLDDPSA